MRECRVRLAVLSEGAGGGREATIAATTPAWPNNLQLPQGRQDGLDIYKSSIDSAIDTASTGNMNSKMTVLHSAWQTSSFSSADSVLLHVTAPLEDPYR